MADDNQGTAPKQQRIIGKPLQKGYDPRRNLKGVPKSAIAARRMFRNLAAELVKIKDEDGTEIEVTRLYARARQAFSTSSHYKEFEMMLKAIWPELLKENVDLTSAGQPVTFQVIYDQKKNPDADSVQDPPAPAPSETG